MPAPGKWLPLEEARAIVVQQGFKRQADFYAWKSRPANVPSNPRAIYDSAWLGWAYFLGTGPAREESKPKKQVAFLPFEQARAHAQDLMRQHGIVNQTGWSVFAKTSDKPENIPADPLKAYKDKGWIGWPDWLGRKPSRATGLETVRTFHDAREFARTLGLKQSREWYAWAATAARPADVPYSPDTRYRDEGWIGWGDFLGFHSRWTHQGIVGFLDSLTPCIEHLTELDLYLILSRNGMLRRDTRLRGAKLLRSLLKHARTQKDLENAKNLVAAELQAEQDSSVSGGSKDVPDEISVEELEETDGSTLRPLDILESLETVDRVVELKITDDPEVLDFMVKERVDLLWQEAMASGESAVASALARLPEGNYSGRIRSGFTEQLEKVKSLPHPDGYRIVDAKDQPVELNLMQRLTAYRILHEKRIGNWSGVGSGKTHAAVYSSAVMDAHMTLVLAANSTVASWRRTIRRSFPEASIHVHDGKPLEFRFMEGRRNFLVVNYEAFQQAWSADFIKNVTAQAPIDFIVFDEVQFARQRHEAEKRMSERRRRVNSLIELVLGVNPDVRILAMSATPVVNNLREAVKLLELILPGQDFSDVPVGASMANAINVHFLLRKHGIRVVPRYEQQLEKTPVAIDGQEWFDQLSGLQARDVLRMEQTLLQAKLRNLGSWVRRGTLIYTYYVEGIVEPLTQALDRLGFKSSLFTGKERVTVENFVDDYRNNRADVLIGSAPVGTGVDGLQFVLDRIVFITLPFSNAEYEQIVGRLWRQGSAFGKVEVILPQVTLREERAGQWSWDDLRLRLIEYKQTLADAALDGIIPKGGLPSREEMQRRSLGALKQWAEAVSRGLPATASDQSQNATSPSGEPNPTPVV